MGLHLKLLIVSFKVYDILLSYKISEHTEEAYWRRWRYQSIVRKHTGELEKMAISEHSEEAYWRTGEDGGIRAK